MSLASAIQLQFNVRGKAMQAADISQVCLQVSRVQFAGRQGADCARQRRLACFHAVEGGMADGSVCNEGSFTLAGAIGAAIVNRSCRD